MHAVALPENLIRVIIVWEVAKGHLDLVERTRKVVGERRDCAYVRVKAISHSVLPLCACPDVSRQAKLLILCCN